MHGILKINGTRHAWNVGKIGDYVCTELLKILKCVPWYSEMFVVQTLFRFNLICPNYAP